MTPEILSFVLPHALKCVPWHKGIFKSCSLLPSKDDCRPPRPWCTLLGVWPMVLSDLPLNVPPLPHTLLPFSPQWLSRSSDLIIHTSLRVPTVSDYRVSSAACLGFVPGNRNPNHTVRGFILLSWIQYTTLWQGKTHLEKNRLYTRMWTCHKIHFSFQLKLPLLKRSPYRAVWQHKALRRKGHHREAGGWKTNVDKPEPVFALFSPNSS